MSGKGNILSKKNRHYEPELALMLLTILVIAGFQFFWISQNYKEEKKNLAFRSNIVFRETILKLQGSRLKIGGLFGDSSRPELSFQFKEDPGVEDAMPGPRFITSDDQATNFLNDVTIKIKDSLNKIRGISVEKEYRDTGNKRTDRSLTIAVTKPVEIHKGDSVYFRTITKGPDNQVVRFLYRVDSLQDSLRVKEIDSACRAAFGQQGLADEFSVIKTDSPHKRADRFMPARPDDMNRVTIGFVHPATYELQLGTNFWYLVKRITYPVLFSVFLVGLTILSLFFLYRNLQKQRRLTAIKNDFISNVTHELKTPIATVGVAIEALRSFNALNDPQRTKEYLDISQNELNRLSLLVDKVLKLSMFENHEMEVKKENVDLSELVQEVMDSFQLQFEKRGAVCNFSRTGENFIIHADKMHITSVVYNLLDNALKYSPDKPEIEIRLNDENDFLHITVKDNGIGIPKDYQSKVFDKFFRVPAGDKHNVKGYGLGLSYVAQVVARHGGTVTVVSETGKGSTFNIKLPRNNG